MTCEPIVILQQEAEVTAAESALAQKLQLPLRSKTSLDSEQTKFELYFENGMLCLQALSGSAPGALYVDFSALKKRASDALLKQNLLKAIGARRGKRPSVLDATAGLGADSFLMATAGCRVEGLEKHNIVFALLEDGLTRFRKIANNNSSDLSLQIKHQDFISYEPNADRPQVVYLDPMFPPKSKSAQAKKPMTYLQALVGEADSEELMFAAAKQHAGERIVVKRAKNSPLISAEKPDISFKGSSSRFDVYLVN